MNTPQLKKFCRNLPGANERLLADPYNILVYSLDDRNFAYFKTSEPEKWRFSIKVTPVSVHQSSTTELSPRPALALETVSRSSRTRGPVLHYEGQSAHGNSRHHEYDIERPNQTLVPAPDGIPLAQVIHRSARM